MDFEDILSILEENLQRRLVDFNDNPALSWVNNSDDAIDCTVTIDETDETFSNIHQICIRTNDTGCDLYVHYNQAGFRSMRKRIQYKKYDLDDVDDFELNIYE